MVFLCSLCTLLARGGCVVPAVQQQVLYTCALLWRRLASSFYNYFGLPVAVGGRGGEVACSVLYRVGTVSRRKLPSTERAVGIPSLRVSRVSVATCTEQPPLLLLLLCCAAAAVVCCGAVLLWCRGAVVECQMVIGVAYCTIFSRC